MKEKIIKALLLIILFVSFVINIILGVLLFTKNSDYEIIRDDRKRLEDQLLELTKTSQNPGIAVGEGDVIKTVEKEFFSVEIPNAWSVKELIDGETSTTLVEGTVYSGLTGIEIKDETGTLVFKLYGILGVGGAACNRITAFPDTEQTYVSELKKNYTDNNTGDFTITSVNSGEYKNLTIFDTQFRRFQNRLYTNLSTKSGVFNPVSSECNSFHKLKGLSFKATSNGKTENINDFLITIELRETDKTKLEILDEVLKSLSLN